MANAAIAAYEAAYDLVLEPSAFAAMSSLPHPAPVLFCLTGMDEPVSWPLCAAQATQISALYPNKIISESDILVDERYLDDHDHMLDEINRVCLPHLGPSSGVYMDLSHLVVDDVGDADSFRLQPSNDDEINATTFGQLIVLLPSEHTDGVITFTYGNHSETFDDDTLLLETAFAAAFLTTTITSAPITSGRRVALVYRLYYGDADKPMRMEPTVQDAAIAAFHALGHSRTQEVQRLGLELEVAHYPLSFEHFTYAETEFVNVLLAAGNFDVGVARLDSHEKGQVEMFEPHPACDIPEAVVDSVIDRTLQGFLHMPPVTSDGFKCPRYVLVFWPKRHRVCVVDVVGVLDFLLLRQARGNDDDDGYLGISDTHELVLGVMPHFVTNELAKYVGVHKNALPRNLSCIEKMQRLLMALNDVAVSASFLDVITIQFELSLTEVASFIYDLLTKHSWLPLQSAMLRLVQRWVQIHPYNTLQLLTSLAGLDTNSPVCPPLRQPYEAELFKRCYDVVLATRDVFTNETAATCNIGPTVVKGLFLLDHYLMTTAPQLQDANYASHRLPLSLVPAIDAFLFAYPSIESLLLPSTVLYPLEDLGVGLASAVRCQPSLPLPPTVIDKVLAMIRAPLSESTKFVFASRHVDVAAAVLVLASLSQRLDANLFDILVDIYGLQLLPAATSIAVQLPIDSIGGQLLATYIAASVDALVDESKWPVHCRQVTGWYDQESYKSGADFVVSAVKLLQRFAPDTVLAFASRWLQLLPTTLDVLRDRLVPVVPRLDRNSSVFRLLKTVLLDRFAAAPALPNIVSFATPSPPDLDPDHCYECNKAHLFLAQANMATAKMYKIRRDICANLAHIVDANATRLRIVSGDDGKCLLEKVRLPTQVSEAEWEVHHAKAQIYARIASCIAPWTSPVGDAQEDSTGESTERPAKRVRRS